MADRGDTHYHVPALNLWFLGSSAFFLLTMVWTVIDDWDAEWKQYQREFRGLELAKTAAQVVAMEEAGARALETDLRARVDAAQAALEARADELEAAEDRAYRLKEDRFKVEESYKQAKSLLAWRIYQQEKKLLEEIGQGNLEYDEERMAEAIADVQAKVNQRFKTLEEHTLAWEAAEAEVAALRLQLTEAQGELANGTRELTRMRERIDNLDPAALSKQAAFVVRDFPGLDFIGPNLKIQKFVLDDITFNLNFTTKPRIDMCTTCHMGADRGDFAGDAQPYGAHPRLDLYLTSKSAHPIKKVGCTVCHRGSGESLSFQHADHRPSDGKEAERWHDDHHWHKQHHWDYPMLRDENIEAGCVQCHKSSMELIAQDAPTLFRGYKLFEAKGCYACHKVDWFPTSRKPGPSLTNLAAKLQPEFVNEWVARPRDFRPTTHMPQLFHLENLPPDEVVVKSRWGTERDMTGEEWNDAAVAAITTFLFANHPRQDLGPIPTDLEGDAERGREVMNLSGCFGCHNTAPFEGEEGGPPLLSNRVTGHSDGLDRNQLGPSLRGVATKLDPTWLYHWILDPKAYWEGTRMPDLRLSEQDALDIVTYMTEDPDGVFMDVPVGWTVDPDWVAGIKHDVLMEQARWFFQKDGRQALEDRIQPGGEWEEVQVLAANVGRALVSNHGCFSCHMVAGMETMMPIGTELSSWGSKTVDKLDFGQHYLEQVRLPADWAKENGIPEEERTLPKLDHHYREGWLERKLAHPRVYDIDKVKSPKDKLRMPWFGFSQGEIQALTTFLVGLVEDEVGPNAMRPTHEQSSIEAGLRAVRQNNCLACHMIEPPTVTYLGADGAPVTVIGEVQALSIDDPLPPRMDSLAALRADVADSLSYSENEEVGVDQIGEYIDDYFVRLLAVDPDHGVPEEVLIIPQDKLLGVTPPLGGDFVRHVTEYYKLGTAHLPNEDFDPDDPDSGPAYYAATLGWDEDNSANLIEDVDGQQRAYAGEQYDKVRWSFAPPVLFDEGHKLQTDWFYAFLKDPIPLRPQLRVRMPSFHFDPGEAEAIADYFAAKSRWEWHARYARTLRTALGRTINQDLADGSTRHEWDLPRQALEWPVLVHVTSPGVLSLEALAERTGADPSLKLEARTLAAIEAGAKPETLASFAKLLAFGDAQGFAMVGPIKVGHDLVQRRTPSYVADHGGLFPIGEAIARDGVDCYQCHEDPNDETPYLGLDPIAWAPSLEHARSRLREDWLLEWFWSPKRKYAGTTMPENFATPEHQYDEQYPGSTDETQIEAILAWLYNLDRPESK